MPQILRPAPAAPLVAFLLVAVSATSTLAFACVTPFPAFAVAAAYALSLRRALLAAACVWLANQVIGFAFLSYPFDLNTSLWGLAIGVAVMLATPLAHVALKHASRMLAIALATSFAAAFAAYEASLFVVTFALGGGEAFTPGIVGQFAILNLVWAGGLVGAASFVLPIPSGEERSISDPEWLSGNA